MRSKNSSSSPHVSSANAYTRDVVKGKILTCRWVRLACQRHLTDLKRKWDYRFDRSRAERSCEFIESFAHTKGRWAIKQEQIRLEPWQCFVVCSLFGWVEVATGNRRFREGYVECPRKNGKMLALDTPIPTPHGWATIGSVHVGDLIFDENGFPCRVTDLSEIDQHPESYRLNFSNGDTIVACADHLWMTTAHVDQVGSRKGKKQRRWKVPTLAINKRSYAYVNLHKGQKYLSRADDPDLLAKFAKIAAEDLIAWPLSQDSLRRIRTTKEIYATQRYGKRNDVNHSLLMPYPLVLENIPLPIDPYLLGLWLGDGTSTESALTCHVDDFPTYQTALEDAGYRIRRIYRKQETTLTFWYSVPGHTCKSELRALGLIKNKHIPAVYLRASFSQRLALLQGLMDTDGTINKNGLNLDFSNSHPPLIAGVSELLATLGIKHSCIEKQPYCQGKPGKLAYRLQFTAFRDELPIFRLPRKLNRMRVSTYIAGNKRSKTVQIVSVTPCAPVPMRCLRVDTPSHQFLVGKSILPTHNSLLAAAIGLAFFAADQENGAEVYSGATTEKQAWEIFRPAHLMAKRSPDFCETFGIVVSASNLAIPDNGSRFEPLIGNPGDGASPSCALIDEYHEHKNDNLYQTMITGMGAREQPLVLVTTTAGSNLASPCYLKRQDCCKMLEGVLDNERQFAVIYTLDDDASWTDPAALRMANPNYGVSVGADYLLDRQRAAQQSARLQNAFKTKHLNQWVGAYTAWMDMVQWKQQPPRLSLVELAGRACCVGIDLASKIDIAAMVFVFPPIPTDPLWHIHGRYYLPETVLDDAGAANVSHYATWEKLGLLTLTAGNVIDYDVIQEDLIEIAKSVDLRRVAYDPWTAASLANSLQKHAAFKPKVIRGKEEFKIVEFPQTVKNFSGPMKEVEGFIRQHLFAHGDCPVLTWMFSNVVAREDKNENIFPVKEAVGNKIDGAVATLMAVARALVEVPPKISKYETQGLLIG